jgi:short-subunit dehydrogenase
MKAGAARVLLTGATGGIGQAAAEALLRQGASVMLVGRSAPALQALRARLAQDAPAAPLPAAQRLATLTADLTRAADVVALAATAQAWAANVVVHAAGVPAFGPLAQMDDAAMAQALQVNLLAPMALTRALLPALQRLPAAQVVFVGSALGRIGLPGFSVYSAAKFGLHGFAEALRRELADTAVRVQYLGPRSTDTGFNDAAVQAYNQATGTACDPPSRAAAALVELIESGAAERHVGWPERLAVRLNGLAPEWLDASFAGHRRALAATTPHALAETP